MTMSMRTTKLSFFCWFVLLGYALLWLATHAVAQSTPGTEWPTYANDPSGTRYSPLTQIDRSNVSQLKMAWTYRTHALDQAPDPDLNHKAAFEATPILVQGKLFLSTPYDHVIALNPQSGEKLWEFDPKLDVSHGYSEVTSRGVSAWRDIAAKPGQQ